MLAVMRVFGVLLLVAACDRVYGLSGRGEDAAIDTLDVMSDSAMEVCGGDGFVRVCSFVLDSVVTLRNTIDTGTDARCQAHRVVNGVADACVIVADDITVQFTLRAVGARPLLLFATHGITVSAPIDVSSDRAGEPGAGARTDCASTNGVMGASSGGGGGGGTYQYAGGPGGSAGTAPGGGPRAVSPLSALAGGCAGGLGGGTAPLTVAGAGGGAIYLIAGTSIQIDATGGIDASGAGGSGGAAQHGGGGGGSGGLIGLDAPSIVIAGNIIAKGGAGGGGGDMAMGAFGAEAVLAAPNAGVAGGAGGGTGGSGGDGSNGTIGGTPNGTPIAGGGGGGGGAGHVLVYGVRTGGGILNPAASP